MRETSGESLQPSASSSAHAGIETALITRHRINRDALFMHLTFLMEMETDLAQHVSDPVPHRVKRSYQAFSARREREDGRFANRGDRCQEEIQLDLTDISSGTPEMNQ